MENKRVEELCIDINKKLNKVSTATSEHTIYKVPEHLLNVNKKAYEPQLLAIGPYHRGKDQLKRMEEYKMRYLKILLQRKEESSLSSYVTAINKLEEQARKCYAESVALDKDKFVEMMLLDGCFIVELLRNHKKKGYSNDPIFKVAWIRKVVCRDVLLVENQLPFFVLHKLFEMTSTIEENFSDIIHEFFCGELPKENKPERCTLDVDKGCIDKVEHLLGLLHADWLPSEKMEKKSKWEVIRCATELKEAGIKFKVVKEINLFNVKFKNGVLEIPRLEIDDQTESMFRNLISYEQFFLDKSVNYVTDYMTLMDCLINSSKDVELLCQRRIIHNLLGDEEVVAQLFNRLGDHVVYTHHNFYYSGLFYDVNNHCKKLWNRRMANLRHNYFNTPWAFISFLAAFFLLLLTLTQTLFGGLDYFTSSTPSSPPSS